MAARTTAVRNKKTGPNILYEDEKYKREKKEEKRKKKLFWCYKMETLPIKLYQTMSFKATNFVFVCVCVFFTVIFNVLLLLLVEVPIKLDP